MRTMMNNREKNGIKKSMILNSLIFLLLLSMSMFQLSYGDVAEKITAPKLYKPAELNLEVTKVISKELKGYLNKNEKKIKIEIPEMYSDMKNQQLSFYEVENLNSDLRGRASGNIREPRFSKSENISYLEIDYDNIPSKFYIVGNESGAEKRVIYSVKSLEEVEERVTYDTRNTTPNFTIYIAPGAVGTTAKTFEVNINNTSNWNGYVVGNSITTNLGKHKRLLFRTGTNGVVGTDNLNMQNGNITLKLIKIGDFQNKLEITLKAGSTLSENTTGEVFQLYESTNNSSNKLDTDKDKKIINHGSFKIIVGTPPISLSVVQDMNFGTITAGDTETKTATAIIDGTNAKSLENYMSLDIIYALGTNANLFSTGNNPTIYLIKTAGNSETDKIPVVISKGRGDNGAHSRHTLTGTINGVGEAPPGNYSATINATITARQKTQGGLF